MRRRRSEGEEERENRQSSRSSSALRIGLGRGGTRARTLRRLAAGAQEGAVNHTSDVSGPRPHML